MQLSKIEQLCPPTSLPIDQTEMVRIEWNRSMCEDTRYGYDAVFEEYIYADRFFNG